MLLHFTSVWLYGVQMGLHSNFKGIVQLCAMLTCVLKLVGDGWCYRSRDVFRLSDLQYKINNYCC
jgi:hypothetical protein